MEREILKRAAAFFVAEDGPKWRRLSDSSRQRG
jgi:hypothetical protein